MVITRGGYQRGWLSICARPLSSARRPPAMRPQWSSPVARKACTLRRTRHQRLLKAHGHLAVVAVLEIHGVVKRAPRVSRRHDTESERADGDRTWVTDPGDATQMGASILTLTTFVRAALAGLVTRDVDIWNKGAAVTTGDSVRNGGAASGPEKRAARARASD